MSPKCQASDNILKIIKSGRIPHSFMLEGGNLDDRMEMALFLAKAIVCESEDNKPCDNCHQCKITDSLSNPDIITVSNEDDKKFISVAQIRKLRADAFVLPHSANKKVFIIKNAELMNEQAQNALLKILEEPPASVVFILLTPSRTLELVTIVSRCSIFMLSGEKFDDESINEDAREILSLVFDTMYYDILKSFKKYEKDRAKAEKLFIALKSECVLIIKDKNASNFRKKILTKIYYKTDEYIELIHTNVNMSLLFSSVTCMFRNILN